MTNNLSYIKSSLITDAVCFLCRKAACILPEDVYIGINELYSKETSETARGFLEEILVNAEIAAETQRPICQDTGITVVFIEIGQNVFIEGEDLESAVNNGVAKAYQQFFLRKSVVENPIFNRKNTQTNTPAVIHTQIVHGNSVKITVLPKGSGSENMSAVKMLKPSDGIDEIVNFVLETVKNAGANSCPPLHVGIGIGGTMEYAALLSKKALLNKIMPLSELKKAAKTDEKKELELRIFLEIQKTKIGAEGFGGNSTAFAVNIETYPCHIAGLPIAVNLNCHAARHAEIIIDENTIIPDKLQTKFEISKYRNKIDYSKYKKLTLPLENKDIIDLKAGDRVLLTGEIYTARDAAHKKLIEALKSNKELPFELKNQIIYYTGPCPAMADEIIGPAGPTTALRMDKYTPQLLDLGLKGMIGKGGRGYEVLESIKKNKAIYFVATGGAGCLISQKIKSADIIAYPELGPEAIYKLVVEDFPVIASIDSEGNTVFVNP
ncbi:MAG TPA: fumarate hydratase [Candidatus Gastranaerophilales bacterium]|nr:fumarate hydratase [Candidatus Gastranaerophilales bacterium]